MCIAAIRFPNEPHSRAVGKVNLCSPDHVSLLIHRTFNASIPRKHLPEDRWQFEYGPAENDPEFGPEATEGEDVESSEGRWVDRASGEKLGGEHGDVEFTVTGCVFLDRFCRRC